MRGATGDLGHEPVGLRISIHAPHAGSDAPRGGGKAEGVRISIHAPHAGSDPERALEGRGLRISIHAPHAGSDERDSLSTSTTSVFQSTLPMRGATLVRFTPSTPRTISIHAPHAGSDRSRCTWAAGRLISIHAPHAGSDLRHGLQHGSQRISIHAPHAGSDHSMALSMVQHGHFNPRSPCGERPAQAASDAEAAKFQSTLPMRGATGALRGHIVMRAISIHAPHAGSDRYIVYANIKCSAIYWIIEQLICCYCVSSRHLLNLCTTFKVRRTLAHDDHLEFAPQNDKNPCGS